jgi:hypothetical protein
LWVKNEILQAEIKILQIKSEILHVENKILPAENKSLQVENKILYLFFVQMDRHKVTSFGQLLANATTTTSLGRKEFVVNAKYTLKALSMF